MVKMFLIALTAVLAVLGLCEVLHSVWLFLISPKIKPKTFSVVWLYDEDDPVRQLHYAGNMFCWCDRIDSDFKIAVYAGISESLYDECKRVAAGYDMIFTTPQMLEHIMERVTTAT